jgi:hypothetical protein
MVIEPAKNLEKLNHACSNRQRQHLGKRTIPEIGSQYHA